MQSIITESPKETEKFAPGHEGVKKTLQMYEENRKKK